MAKSRQVKDGRLQKRESISLPGEDEMKIKIHFNGKVYEVDMMSFNAIEVGEFREKFGGNLLQSMRNFDLDTAAQLLYMWIKKGNPRTEYNEIARAFTYRDLILSRQATKMVDEDGEDAEVTYIDVNDESNDEGNDVADFTQGTG